KHYLFNYATQFALSHEKIAGAADFTLSESDYSEFVRFLKEKDFNYETGSEADLEELRKQAKEENYFDAISAEFSALETKMKADKKDDLQKYREEISRHLEEE